MLALSGPSVVNDRLRLTDRYTVLTYSDNVKLFLQFFLSEWKKSAKTRKKVLDYYAMLLYIDVNGKRRKPPAVPRLNSGRTARNSAEGWAGVRQGPPREKAHVSDIR